MQVHDTSLPVAVNQYPLSIVSSESVSPEIPATSRPIDPSDVNWSRVRKSSFLVHQRFEYEYETPIRDLRHRLIVIPPPVFGDQRRTRYQLGVSQPGEIELSSDAFGNTVVEVRVPTVEHKIEFESWVHVERGGSSAPRVLDVAWRQDARLLTPTTRTTPDAAITDAAAELGRSGATGLALAEAANAWVFRAMTYERGSTSVRTTAAEALASAQGVCQDYAHIMLAICRLLGLPSLYVSGHLLGEGGTHAWVEVLLPASDGSGKAEAWPFDPTHGRRSGANYVSIAVGRDYADVAPTSGRYRAGSGGRLSSRKQVRLTDVAYVD